MNLKTKQTEFDFLAQTMGFSPNELLNQGYTIEDLRSIVYTPDI